MYRFARNLLNLYLPGVFIRNKCFFLHAIHLRGHCVLPSYCDGRSVGVYIQCHAGCSAPSVSDQMPGNHFFQMSLQHTGDRGSTPQDILLTTAGVTFVSLIRCKSQSGFSVCIVVIQTRGPGSVHENFVGN